MITETNQSNRRDVQLQPRHILVITDRAPFGRLLADSLKSAGHDVELVSSAADAWAMLSSVVPDVVVVALDTSDEAGLSFVEALRSRPESNAVALIFLSNGTLVEDSVRALERGADDCMRAPFDIPELVARVQVNLDRPPSPAAHSSRNSFLGLVNEPRLREELAREIGRAVRSGRTGCLAALDIAERESVTKRLGMRADQILRNQVAALVSSAAGELDILGRDEQGRLLILMPETEPAHAQVRLHRMSETISRRSFNADGEAVDLTPVTGFTRFGTDDTDRDAVIERAIVAAAVAKGHLDLQPIEWEPSFAEAYQAVPQVAWTTKVRRRLRTPMQILITIDIGIVLPFIVYLLFDRAGLNIAPFVYFAVVAALLATATLIWTEGFLAFKPVTPPASPPVYPPASAIIAAYLPNEAATLIQTVEAFLRMDYPGDYQVVLAYNTPQPMPIEETLHHIAQRDPRFIPYRVEGSSSKAQNVNAALGQVSGSITGVFDADHVPSPDAFSRAACWLENGYDVVQGHCAVRNGETSLVARIVAVEFEAIYAVSHPGRARLHGFGLFGGSNGFWRTDLLRKIRMHGFMLTEDIDSSLRVVEEGGRIASDPELVSRELAPTTVGALWNQRMRWAQGWFQVSRKHLLRGWHSRHMSLRQKLGFTILLAWREIYPWLSIQVIPLLAFFAWKAGGVTDLDLLIPLFVLTTLFTLSVGPGQTLFAYRLATPEIRRHRGWFVLHLVVSSLVYTEMKNVIGRVAQIKELTGDRQWKVTPRPSAVAIHVEETQ